MADQKNENSSGYAASGAAVTGAAIGWTCYKWTQGINYVVNVRDTGSAVQIYDKMLKNTKALIRIDRPHKGMPFDHVNINPKPAGLKTDPHIRLPSGSADASAKFARGLKAVNSVIESVTIGLTAIEIGQAIYDDYYENTHQKKTETAARLTASSTAGCLGAQAGAAIGTAIFPGVGTIVGGFAGAIGSSIGAGYYATKLVHDNYDTIAEKTGQFGQSTIDNVKAAGIGGGEMLTTAGAATMSIIGNYFRPKNC